VSKLKNLIGMKFGRLTVADRAENDGRNIRWNCICECGGKAICRTSSLLSGNSKSCNCLSVDNLIKRSTTHGQSKTKIYTQWSDMKNRCNNPKNSHYKNYGGRGIEVCKEWNEDYLVFIKWASENGYDKKLEIDRINVNGNYEPSNCRWATIKQQSRNKRNTFYLKIDGVIKPFAEWCEIYDINYKLAHERYTKGYEPKNIFSHTKFSSNGPAMAQKFIDSFEK